MIWQYKHTMFKLSGQDILVIPNKYVNELRNMPDHKLSSIQANIDVSCNLEPMILFVLSLSTYSLST